MKLIVLACLAAAAVAAPQFEDIVSRPIVQVIRDERVDEANGYFTYALEADNGIFVEAAGVPGSVGQSNIEGTYRLPDGAGGFENVIFVANENGFQPQSSLLPTPHPLPDHVVELLRIAEEQRAAGITFDEQGRRLRR